MSKRIALYGGSFNPPTIAHRRMVENVLAAGFDQVVVIPCGSRPDKDTTNDISPTHRAIMTDIAFRGLGDKVVIDLDDLDREEFTPTWYLDRHWREQGDVWHVVGYDLIKPGADGVTPIKGWHHGEELWSECNFAVAPRGQAADPAHLPPRHMPLPAAPSIASSDVRRLIFSRQPFAHHVAPEVAAYINRHGLYRGRPPVAKVSFEADRLIPTVIADPDKPGAVALADQIAAKYGPGDAPNAIMVLGGDGFFMETLRAHWRRRLPFVGLNMGHEGHFMNALTTDVDPFSMLERTDLVVRQSPILHVEWEDLAGERHSEFGVNDAWLERDTGQSASISLTVDGVPRVTNARGDGILVASAAGSSGYAYNLGATPLFDQPGLVVAGIVPSRFLHWDPLHEKVDAVIRMEALDIDKRPVMAFIDSVEKGRARSMTVRTSRVAAVEIVFAPENDLEQKRLRYQYPST